MSSASANIIYGYARVSSQDQNLARQIDALTEYGVQPKYIVSEKASGKNFNRPEYMRLFRRLKKGDTLVVVSLDRLGRNYDEIQDEWRKITKKKGAAIVVLDMPILDTRQGVQGVTGQFISDIVLQLLSYVAQIERESIKRRQAEGIKAAQERGVRFGRPPKARPSNYEEVCQAMNEGRLPVGQAAELLGVCPQTLKKWREEDESAK